MKPLSTRIVKTEASYGDIMASVDSHDELTQMKSLVMEKGVCIFMYRGCEDTAIVMMKQKNKLYMRVCPCPSVMKLKSNPSLVYALCYGI